MRQLLHYGVLIFVAFLTIGHARGAETKSSASTTDTNSTGEGYDANTSEGPHSRSRPDNSTCSSRAVNYITHTLPQQCLRTDRVAANATKTSASNELASGPSTIAPISYPASSEFVSGPPLQVSPSGTGSTDAVTTTLDPSSSPNVSQSASTSPQAIASE